MTFRNRAWPLAWLFLAGTVQLAGIVLCGLGERAGADKLNDLLRQLDRMH